MQTLTFTINCLYIGRMDMKKPRWASTPSDST